MTNFFRKGKSLFSTTLSVGIGTGTSETISFSSTVGLPTDTEITLTIDRVDAGGMPTPTKLERIIGTISGSGITSYIRGQDGTSDQAHSAGAVVEYIWNGKDLSDLVDGFLVGHNQPGTHKSTVLDEMVLGTEAEGDIIYRGATQWARLGKGTAGWHLRMNSTTDAPEWAVNTTPTKRIGTTASSATPSINCDDYDGYTITALAAAITSVTITGTPKEQQGLVIRIKDNGTAHAIAWGTSFRASGDLELPITTTISKTMYCGFIYNITDSKWDLVGYLDNF